MFSIFNIEVLCIIYKHYNNINADVSARHTQVTCPFTKNVCSFNKEIAIALVFSLSVALFERHYCETFYCVLSILYYSSYKKDSKAVSFFCRDLSNTFYSRDIRRPVKKQLLVTKVDSPEQPPILTLSPTSRRKTTVADAV